MDIEALSPTTRDLPQLVTLMRDAVEHGASIGFLPPLTDSQAVSFWSQRLKEITSGKRIVLVGRVNGEVVGSVQLALAEQPNAPHRAEVQKLFVHTSHRGKGYARQLMQAIEIEAQRVGRQLLILDTKQGDAAEKLYGSMGWTPCGVVPGYAQQADGSFCATTIFYKRV